MTIRAAMVSAAAIFTLTCGLAGALAAGVQEPAVSPSAARPAPQVYAESGCSHCHMLNGAGGHKGPNLSTVGRRMSTEAITKQIREGGGAMPPYGDALSAEEIQRLAVMLKH